MDYILDPANREEIVKNVAARKGKGDLDRVLELSSRREKSAEDRAAFVAEAARLPNRSHPAAAALGDEPRVVRETKWRPHTNPNSKTEIKEASTRYFLKIIRQGS